MLPDQRHFDHNTYSLSFVENMSEDMALNAQSLDPDIVLCRLPLSITVPKLPLAIARSLCREHSIHVNARTAKSVLIAECSAHKCSVCEVQVTLFKVIAKTNRKHKWAQSAKGKAVNKEHKKVHGEK